MPWGAFVFSGGFVSVPGSGLFSELDCSGVSVTIGARARPFWVSQGLGAAALSRRSSSSVGRWRGFSWRRRYRALIPGSVKKFTCTSEDRNSRLWLIHYRSKHASTATAKATLIKFARSDKRQAARTRPSANSSAIPALILHHFGSCAGAVRMLLEDPRWIGVAEVQPRVERLSHSIAERNLLRARYAPTPRLPAKR